MFVLGLLVLAAVVVVGSGAVASNIGSAHQLPSDFSVFGYHIHGSAGKLFFAGLVIGAIGAVGFGMVVAGLRHNAALRRELLRLRREARREAPAAPAKARPSAPSAEDRAAPAGLHAPRPVSGP
jgi:hypothetical protein